MKKIDYLVIHSTNTSEIKDLTQFDVVDQHLRPIAKGGFGFNRPGFDYLILRDGTLETLVNEQTPTDVDLWGISGGKYGINGSVKHIAYVGGRTLKEVFWKDTRTQAQKRAMEILINFYILRFPNIVTLGFDDPIREEESKNPAFDVRQWLRINAIAERNQYRRPRRVRTF